MCSLRAYASAVCTLYVMTNVLIRSGETTTIALSTCEQVIITSSSYPYIYPDDIREEWYIVAPPDHQVFLHFTNFSLEHCCDFLDISDGIINTRLSGSSLPRDLFSHGQNLSIKFTTDESVRYPGFRVEASAFNTSCKYSHKNNGICCKGHFGSDFASSHFIRRKHQ